MKTNLISTLLALLFLGCESKPTSLYQSETLVIHQISDHTYQHITYLQTEDYGKVACNGLVVIDSEEAVIFDTPSENEVSIELIDWVEKEMDTKIVAIVPTHFHLDCLGGLKAFHEREIPSVAHHLTIQLLDSTAVLPWQGFDQFTNLTIGQKEVIVDFLGEGHTRDNVIGYFPSEKVLFGGCLIKSLQAGRGYLGDANLEEWTNTVLKVKAKYPDTQKVIPGHGDSGGTDLLDYTAQMFTESSQ